MATVLVYLPEQLLAQLDEYVTQKKLPTRDAAIWEALNLFFNGEAICTTCEDGYEFAIPDLPLSGSLCVCPKCGESSFELWRRNTE